MSKPIALISIIEDIIHLLTGCEEENWKRSFVSFLDQCSSLEGEITPSVRTDILRIYGGMGSFNDLVLYSDGQPMVKENEELDKLRGELLQVLTW